MSSLSASLTLAVAFAISAASAITARQRPAFSSGTDAVLVDVLVSERGRPVTGLHAADFVVRDNGVIEEAALLETADVPQNLFLVVDTGSELVAAASTTLTRGIDAILRRLQPRDRVAVVSFSDRARIVASLMPHRAVLPELRRAFVGHVDRHSAVSDALFVTTLLSRREPGRSIVLIFTQGEDSVSWLPDKEVIAAAGRSNALVYGVTLHRPVDRTAVGFRVQRDSDGVLRREDLERSFDGGRDGGNPSGVLHKVASTTGGRVVYADSSVPLEQTLTDVFGEFRTRYILAFRPSKPTVGWHELSIAVKSRRSAVSARKGYFLSR